MKLEILLALLLGCPIQEEPVIPHPLPYMQHSTKNESSPEITIIYNNDLPITVTGYETLKIPSKTNGGSLKIEINDSNGIEKYLILKDNYHLACSNDNHPSNPQQKRIVKQYSIPLYSRILVCANDEKGNASEAVIEIMHN